MVKHDLTTKQAVWVVLSENIGKKMNAPQIASLCISMGLVKGIQHNTVIKNLKFLRDEGRKIESEYPEGKQNKVFWVDRPDANTLRKFKQVSKLCECEMSYFIVSIDGGKTWNCNVCSTPRQEEPCHCQPQP